MAPQTILKSVKKRETLFIARSASGFYETRYHASRMIPVRMAHGISNESIPFEIKVPKLNAETIEAIEDAEKGIGLSKGYTNLDEMWKDLEKED